MREARVSDLIGRQEIAQLAGVSANTIRSWVMRHEDFPAAVAASGPRGRLWDRREVLAWLIKTERIEVE